MNKVLGLLLSTFLALPALAADWPAFRNDASNAGASTETLTLPLVERWHSTAPAVEENGAVVSNGIAYMSSNPGYLYAFDVATGTAITGFPVATSFNYGTPAVDAINGIVYVLAGGQLYAFNLDGTTAWTRAVGTTGYNYNQGPVIDEGYVYFKAGNNLHKYDSSGTSVWVSVTSGNNTQPAIMGDHVYVNSEAGQIRKYLKSDGSEITTGGFPIATAAQTASLTAVNGRLFFKADQLYAYNASDGSTAWSAASGGNSSYNDSPAVANGVVYVYGADSIVYAFDETTGAPMTGFPSVYLGSAGSNYSSPSVAGDLVFVGAGRTQILKVLGAANHSTPGVVLEEHLTFSTDTQGFDLCSPVVSDGIVFAMLDGGGLYAFFSNDNPWTGGAVEINAGADCTDTRDVTLTLDRGSNVDADQMQISEDPFFVGAVWEPYATTKPWVLSAGFGTKTIYVQFRVGASGPLSNVFNDQINYSEVCAVAAIATTKTADQPQSQPGTLNGYTITFTNTDSAPATLNTITDTLSAGFTYLAGTTTGATTSDPAISSQQLTWTGPFNIPATGSLQLHFQVQVPATPGLYYNQAGGEAADNAVAPTGPTAPIQVGPAESGAIPTLGTLGLLGFALLLAIAGVLAILRLRP